MKIFAVFLVGYTLSQFFRVFLAVIAPELRRDLALDGQDVGAHILGAMSAAWAITFALAQFPVGYAFDRFGPRRTASVLMLAAAAGSALLAVAQSAATAIAAMALIGLGCSPIYMAALFVFGRIYPQSRFGMLASLLLALGTLGNLLATTPLGWAAVTYGWRTAMLVIGVAMLASAALVAVLVEDPPRLDDASRDRDGFWSGFTRGIVAVLSIRALWPLMPLITVSYAVVIAERGLWAGPYLAEVHGLDTIGRGHALFAMGIAMSAAALAYGPLDQWLGARRRLVASATLVTACAFLLLGARGTPSPVTAVALLMLIGAVGHTYTVLMAHGRVFLPDHLLGRGITCLNFLFIGGSALLQAMSGVAVSRMVSAGVPADLVYGRLHMAFGALLVVAGAIYLRSRER